MDKGMTELCGELVKILKDGDSYLEVGDELARVVKPLFGKALKILLTTGLDIYDDLNPEFVRISALKAKGLRNDYDNYRKAGFTKEEAFKLVIASIKPINFTEIIKNTTQSIKSRSK